MKDNITVLEKLENGDHVDIVSNDEITRCLYVDQENNEEVLLVEINDREKNLIMYPTNTRIGSSSFLQSKYGINFLFEGFEVIIEESFTEKGVHVIHGLPEVFNISLRYGLGLRKEYRFISEITRNIEGCKTIIISNDRKTEIDGTYIIISDRDLDKIRRGIDRIADLYRYESMESKRVFVHNELLHNSNSELFPLIKKTSQKEVIYRIVKDMDITKSVSHRDKASLLDIKNEVDSNYFTILKSNFDKKIEGNHKENIYQKFFEENPLLLTLFIGSPYIKMNNQAYVGGKSFNNQNGQFPDFLYRHKITNNSFIIEIKCPSTPLLETRPYRKTGVYSPSKELSGAISQALTQKYQIETEIGNLIKNADDRGIEAYNVQCFIIIGLLASLDEDGQKAKKRSFELFRHNQKNLRIVTYDECQEQLDNFLKGIDISTGGGN